MSESSPPAAGRPAADLRKEVEKVLDLIRPSVREDGGDLELVAIDDTGTIRIRLLGACVSCPSAHLTLHHGIERTLRSRLGAHLRVEAVR